MKKLNKKAVVLVALSIGCSLYLVKRLWFPSPTEIVGVYTSKDEDSANLTVVILRHPPSTPEAVIPYLKAHQVEFTEHLGLPMFSKNATGDEYTLFVNENFSPPKFQSDLAGFQAEEQICFNGKMNKQCIHVEDYIFRLSDAEPNSVNTEDISHDPYPLINLNGTLVTLLTLYYYDEHFWLFR